MKILGPGFWNGDGQAVSNNDDFSTFFMWHFNHMETVIIEVGYSCILAL
jgi:hypothetical protein